MITVYHVYKRDASGDHHVCARFEEWEVANLVDELNEWNTDAYYWYVGGDE